MEVKCDVDGEIDVEDLIENLFKTDCPVRDEIINWVFDVENHHSDSTQRKFVLEVQLVKPKATYNEILMKIIDLLKDRDPEDLKGYESELYYVLQEEKEALMIQGADPTVVEKRK